jgi:hypothetical protein
MLKVQRDFTYPDGKLAARERVVYEGDAWVSFELEGSQIGAAGSASLRHTTGNPVKDTIEFEYRSEAGGRTKTATETLKGNVLICDMVGPFLASNWDGLARGEEVKCRYIVVPRKETVGFTFRHVKTATSWSRSESSSKWHQPFAVVSDTFRPDTSRRKFFPRIPSGSLTRTRSGPTAMTSCTG